MWNFDKLRSSVTVAIGDADGVVPTYPSYEPPATCGEHIHVLALKIVVYALELCTLDAALLHRGILAVLTVKHDARSCRTNAWH